MELGDSATQLLHKRFLLILLSYLECGTPEWIRTTDLLLRRQTLYPAELRAHNRSISIVARSGRRSNCFAIVDVVRCCSDHIHLAERWLSGRKQRFAKPLYGLKSLPGVRIPPSPPLFSTSSFPHCRRGLASQGLFCHLGFRGAPALRAYSWPCLSHGVHTGTVMLSRRRILQLACSVPSSLDAALLAAQGMATRSVKPSPRSNHPAFLFSSSSQTSRKQPDCTRPLSVAAFPEKDYHAWKRWVADAPCRITIMTAGWTFSFWMSLTVDLWLPVLVSD